ncbi:MAG: hypothetical protein AABW67_02745 [Nanoarchaeota archaeon]
MKKYAKDLKKGDKVTIANQKFLVNTIELSDIGKQGKRKVRLELLSEKQEKLIIIRPDDYIFDSI